MRRLLVIGVSVLALVLGACGDDDDGDDAAEDATTTIAAAAGEEVKLKADLVGGAAEVPDGGDPDGTGDAEVTLDAESGEVCFDVKADAIMTPTLGHIHEGASGVAGPVVVNINNITALKPGERLESCTMGVDKALIGRITANPAGFYVNLHTSDYPKGAIRGQLEK